MPYLSIKKRLEIQYNNKIRAEELFYHYQHINNKNIESEDLKDIFDGKIYEDLLEINLFKDKRDIISHLLFLVMDIRYLNKKQMIVRHFF